MGLLVTQQLPQSANKWTTPNWMHRNATKSLASSWSVHISLCCAVRIRTTALSLICKRTRVESETRRKIKIWLDKGTWTPELASPATFDTHLCPKWYPPLSIYMQLNNKFWKIRHGIGKHAKMCITLHLLDSRRKELREKHNTVSKLTSIKSTLIWWFAAESQPIPWLAAIKST